MDSTKRTGTETGRVGIVGGGQLALMMAEVAPSLDVMTTVLAEHEDDCAVPAATATILGVPSDPAALDELAAAVDVVTFDHEQVDLALLGALVARGVAVRPGLRTLAVATNKVTMREQFAVAGLPVPAFTVVGREDDVAHAVEAFVAEHGLPVVAKPESGGYDGRGVFVEEDLASAVARVASLLASGRVLVEAHVDLVAELAVVVARSASGECIAYPAVETAQLDGMCREVVVPSALPDALSAEAQRIAIAIAELVDSTGVLAVEFFCDRAGELTICEVAARPHNSGHWTIEGSTTSQFANHLLGVLGRPLGPVDLTAPACVMVNVVGADDRADPACAVDEVDGDVAVHLYGKAARPGRKLGHVTALGDDRDATRRDAWAAVRALRGAMPAPGSLPAEVER